MQECRHISVKADYNCPSSPTILCVLVLTNNNLRLMRASNLKLLHWISIVLASIKARQWSFSKGKLRVVGKILKKLVWLLHLLKEIMSSLRGALSSLKLTPLISVNLQINRFFKALLVKIKLTFNCSSLWAPWTPQTRKLELCKKRAK